MLRIHAPPSSSNKHPSTVPILSEIPLIGSVPIVISQCPYEYIPSLTFYEAHIVYLCYSLGSNTPPLQERYNTGDTAADEHADSISAQQPRHQRIPPPAPLMLLGLGLWRSHPLVPVLLVNE